MHKVLSEIKEISHTGTIYRDINLKPKYQYKMRVGYRICIPEILFTLLSC